MSDSIPDLLQRFIDDGDRLSETELETLVATLRQQPQLLVELKEQLLIADLLAQRMDLTRWHFLPQVEQRLRDEEEHVPPLEPQQLQSLHEADQDVAPFCEFRPARPRRRLRWVRWTLALSLLLAVGLSGAWWYAQKSGIAVLEEISGRLTLIRDGKSQPAEQWTLMHPGDQLQSETEATGSLRFLDGTRLRLAEETSVVLRERSDAVPGKHVFVERGLLQAEVAPQPANCPMIFESPTATAEVVGTALQFSVAPDQTQLTVTEGQVRIRRPADADAVTVSQNEFAIVTPEEVAAAHVGWPSSREGLIFLFETNDKPNLVRSISTGVNRSYSLRPRGTAHLNHDYAMVLTGGAFLAEDVDGEILAGCRQTNELSIEATLRPAAADQTGPARIVTFSTDTNNRDFTIGQLGDQLIVRIRTPQTGPNGVTGIDGGLAVCRLQAHENNHVLVSYRPGRLVCYLNGRLVFEGDQIQGDFRDWSAQHLLFGDEYGGSRNWAGTLEGVAIYNRFLEPDEAARNRLQYQHLLHSRPTPARFRVQAELLDKSQVPTVESILPHRSAMVVSRYRVLGVLSGELPHTELYVAQWAVLDGRPQPLAETSVGTVVELLLEPLDLNPQLQQCFVSDDFPPEAEVRRYVEVQR